MVPSKAHGMKNEYVMCVKTDLNLGTSEFVESLLTDWYYGLDPALRPERYDLGEPIRKKLDDNELKNAIETWLTTKMPVMLKRVSRPKFVAGISWRPNKGLDPRPFPWDCVVWLDFSAGDELAIKLFRFLINHFKPAFGWITSYQDEIEKHFITFQEPIGRVEMFVGIDPGETLPGIYWGTYFGPWAIKKIGRQKFAKIPVGTIEHIDAGILLFAYPTCRLVATHEGHQCEEKIKACLGKELFFDKNALDIESLRHPPEDMSIIEGKVQEVLRRRKASDPPKPGSTQPATS